MVWFRPMCRAGASVIKRISPYLGTDMWKSTKTFSRFLMIVISPTYIFIEIAPKLNFSKGILRSNDCKVIFLKFQSFLHIYGHFNILYHRSMFHGHLTVNLGPNEMCNNTGPRAHSYQHQNPEKLDFRPDCFVLGENVLVGKLPS